MRPIRLASVLANARTATIDDATGVGTITDDDSPAMLRVSLSTASGRGVTVDFETADGTAAAPDDYTAKTGAVEFAAGETTKTITVPVKGDSLDETLASRRSATRRQLPSIRYRALLDCDPGAEGERFKGRVRIRRRGPFGIGSRVRIHRYVVKQMTHAKCSGDSRSPNHERRLDTIKGRGTGTVDGRPCPVPLEAD